MPKNEHPTPEPIQLRALCRGSEGYVIMLVGDGKVNKLCRRPIADLTDISFEDGKYFAELLVKAMNNRAELVHLLGACTEYIGEQWLKDPDNEPWFSQEASVLLAKLEGK